MADEGADAKATCAPKYKYDVYISFRGEDTRRGIVSHLFHALSREGLIVFMDDDELLVGDDISSALSEAIEESRISIVILSEKYASSKWCLNELEKILECRKMNNQLVRPIFYHVGPSDVRYQTGIYGEAIAKHESRLGSDHYEKVQRWRTALREVANLSGFDSATGYQTEYQLIEDIVKWVTKSLPSLSLPSLSLPTCAPKYKVGVYISFRGGDTRRGIVSHLSNALRREGLIVHTDEELRKGDDVWPSLCKLIEESRISIVILSEKYASSKWCLNELEKILECRKMNNQLVCPIFYHMDPSDVKHQRGIYGEAIATHESRFGNEKVQKWRTALREVANLSGFDSATGYQTEYQLIEDIVKWVTKSLPSLSLPSLSLPTCAPKYKVGVYISFQGEDTRQGIVSHLSNALLREGLIVHTDEELRVGPSLCKVIEESRISIVILSENYASSKWCLHQLVKILECKKMKNQLVYPIFYNVDSSHVWHQKGSYGEAMAHHEWRFGNDSEEVQKWRSALTEVADLHGWHFKSGDQQENELVESIVSVVTKSLLILPRNDVFLSFSGVDTRFVFTDDLCNALRQEGFETFMSEDALEGEDQISSSLINAIEQSRLSIIVFSENYGYSSCCLDQLVKILECMETKNQQVWPIFYKVDSSDLRHQRKSYGKAMAAHESRFGKDSKKVRKWRSALSEVAYLRGWHFKTGCDFVTMERCPETWGIVCGC